MNTMKHLVIVRPAVAALCFAGLASFSYANSESWIDLLQTEGLKSFREPVAKWTEVGDASMNAGKQKQLSTEPGKGVIYNGGKTKNILTKLEHGDAEVHIEFMVPKGSNSGVYFQGRYEIQVFDSWGVKEPTFSDCGGIYQRWVDKKGFDGHPPRANASKEPGAWQSFDITFKAPRFDADGKKTANAVFVKVVHNGVVVHENVELTGPTRSAAFQDEKALGPLMLQGDHGPVAYRNLRIKNLKDTGR
jgi:hypothetical protein